MTELLALVLLSGFATWRLASLLHSEDAFGWLRARIGIETDEEGHPAIYPETFWGKTFKCFWCLSLWVALPVSLGFAFMAEVPVLWPVIWLVSSTVAIWTEKQILRAQSR